MAGRGYDSIPRQKPKLPILFFPGFVQAVRTFPCSSLFMSAFRNQSPCPFDIAFGARATPKSFAHKLSDICAYCSGQLGGEIPLASFFLGVRSLLDSRGSLPRRIWVPSLVPIRFVVVSA